MDEICFTSRRSPIIACNACISSDQPLATKIGIDILQHGGNAADAAVAIAAALNVLQPHTTGIGGDCFCLFYRASDKRVLGINGSGRSGANATLSKVKSMGYSNKHPLPPNHGLTVTVPGAAAGWVDCTEMFGSQKMTLSEILNPAIRLAEEGFPISLVMSNLWEQNTYLLKGSRHGYELLLDGKSPRAGEVMRMPFLAATLKELATNGKDGFYKGRIARRIIDEVSYAGGCLLLEDFEHHLSASDTILTDPISTSYKDVRLWEIPPNGQGLVALMALNILEGFDLKALGHNSTQYLHLLIEAFQLAFADGLQYIADQDHYKTRLQDLLSKEYAIKRRSLINHKTALGQYVSSELDHLCDPGSDTTYISVVDQQGNACSFINSNYQGFGTGLVPKGCGFSLQNRGLNFSLEENHPNVLAPRKRPYHTIIPAMLTDINTNELLSCYGLMGKFMQPQGHVQLLLNMLEFGMDPQKALDQARICILPEGISQKSTMDHVLAEEGILSSTLQELKDMGHIISGPISGFQRRDFGVGHIISRGQWWNPIKEGYRMKNVLWAGTDPRCDGIAIGF
ncbi:glutathione hydrolase-like YwrD proenzyme isoform X2 [Tachypleus tridentatus]|uniref:glutathione hydrolase-like YwrD proenzyme isoform X2 n=1 Tax=Tachypleus tridentatus TaxID=6853 RepID=UPI003FD612B2